MVRSLTTREKKARSSKPLYVPWWGWRLLPVSISIKERRLVRLSPGPTLLISFVPATE
jgi:hypothetical protein